MKNKFMFKWLLLSVMLSIAGINQLRAALYLYKTGSATNPGAGTSIAEFGNDNNAIWVSDVATAQRFYVCDNNNHNDDWLNATQWTGPNAIVQLYDYNDGSNYNHAQLMTPVMGGVYRFSTWWDNARYFKYQPYIIVGNGSGNWLNGVSWGDGNDQRNIAVASTGKTYSNCPAGLKIFRIIPYGEYDNNHGYSQVTSCNVPYITNEDNNVVFATNTTADITIAFDGTNISITVSPTDGTSAIKPYLDGSYVMCYFGDTWGSGKKYLRQTDNTDDYYHGTSFTVYNYINVAAAIAQSGFKYGVSNTNAWHGNNMSDNIAQGSIYNAANITSVTPGRVPTFNKTSATIITGTSNSGLSASVENSYIGNTVQTITYYYTQDDGDTWTEFDPTNVSSLAAGTYTVRALAFDGNIYTRTETAATLTIEDISVTSISLSPNSGSTGEQSITATFTTNLPTDGTYQYAIRQFTPSANPYGAGYQIGATNIGQATITTAAMTPTFASAGTYKTRVVILHGGSEVYSSNDITFTVSSGGGGGGGSTWYWIDGNGAHNGSEGGITKAAFTETATAGVYTLTRELTQNQLFHLGDGSKGYGPQTPADGAYTNVTATSSNINLAEYGTVYWFTFTPATQQVMMTLNTNASPMTLSFASLSPSTLTTSNSYDAGNPGYTIPSKSASSISIVTTSTITAVEPGTGYTFAGWTLSSNIVVTSGDASTDRTITIRSNGDGAAATAQANYTEDLTCSWYVNSDASSPFTGWGTGGNRMQKKTGHSTEEIYYCKLNITSTGDYGIKMYNDADSGNKYYQDKNNSGSSKSIDVATCNGVAFALDNADGKPNMTFKAYITGEYEFKLDNTGASPTLTITWPEVNQVRIYKATPADVTNTDYFDLGAAVANVRSKQLSLEANTTYRFKIVYNSDYYGCDDGTLTRSTSTSSNTLTTSTSGGDMTLTTDYAGNYTFKFNQSDKTLSVDFPTAYQVSLEVGDVKGNKNDPKIYHGEVASNITVSNGTWIPAGDKVNFWIANSDAAAKAGYDWWGFYDNAAGNNPTQYADSRVGLYTVNSISSNMAVYAVFAETNYWISPYINGQGSMNPNGAYGHIATAVSFEAIPATGYKFDGWEESGGSALTIASPSSATTNVNATAASTLQANFSPRWSVMIKEGGDWCATNANLLTGYEVVSAKDVGYFSTTLEANTNYEIKVYDLQTSTWYGGTADQNIDYRNSGSVNEYTIATTSEGHSVYVQTGAAGTYTFNWNLTDKKIAVVYPTSWYITSDQNLASAGSFTAEDNDSEDVTGGKFVKNGATVTFTASTNPGYVFNGWFANEDYSTGQYTEGAGVAISENTLTLSSIGADKAVYAKWTANNYTVSFNARGGSDLSSTSKSVTMGSAYGTLATVTPPAGYVFDGWYTAADGGTKVTAEDLVATASDHTLYAHYVQKAQVYFKNTLEWDKVYVVYDANWVGTQGTGSQSKTYREMTLVPGTTDVYYDDIPDEYINSWRWNVAFNNTYQPNHYAFTSGEAVFRHDFDKKATMFVPTSNKGATADGNFEKNSPAVQYRSTGYADGTGDNPQYTSGYWRTYNNTYSGYTMTYQKNGGSWSSGHKMECAQVGDNTFIYSVHMDANSQYNFAFYKERDVNTKSVQFNYRTKITSTACTDLKLVCTPENAWMQTTVEGDYVFKLRLEDDGHMYLTVEYPFAVNDYRVRYSYTKGSAQNNYSEIIRAAANGLDTISVFIHSGDSAISRSLTIEKCTSIDNSGVATWNTSYATITLPSETASGKTSGVYNFIITQDGSAAATGAYWNKYAGNYYIRTAASDGGWDMYKYRPDNIMTLSEYSLTQTLSAPYSHYYCRYIESTTMDITYAVATDYSPNISGIMVGDATIGGDGNKTLPASANVRFTWNQETNALRRAYLKSAQGGGNTRFLVLHGDERIFNATTGEAIPANDGQSLAASELLFSDLGNWIYQVELQAYPSATVKLIAQYNGSDRYLVGDAGHSMTIMGGTPASTKYAITAVYDFKTNRLMTVWTPSVAIGDALVDVDMLLVRHKQEDATSVTFNPGGSLTTKKVYGAIRLDYKDLVGKVASWTTTSRPLLKYMVSFPFDVNISDIFGLNTRYGEAYVIQKYDGADRAARGFFRGDGTTTFWKDMEQNEVMRANVGYCVIFDNDYLNGDLGAIWENKSAESSVYLYFPSAGNVGAIASSTKNIEVTALPCNIDREFTVETRTLNHKYTDSNWNLIGVPIFQNSDGVTSSATITTSEDTGDQGESYGTFYYFYDYDVANNRYSIASAAGYNFKTMYSYMLQYAGTVTFTGSTPSSVAARRIADTKKYEIELQVLRNDEEVINRTFVNLKENACDTFALNEDVYMNYNSQAVNIYTLAGNYDVAANVLSIDNHIVPVGVEVTKAGNYSFSMPSDFDGTVVLVDNFDGSRTDLSLGDYSVALPKGTIEDRFTLEINIERSSATDIEGIEGGDIKDGKAHKFVRDGIMYILRDGVIYDAMGKRVK